MTEDIIPNLEDSTNTLVFREMRWELKILEGCSIRLF